MRSIQLGVLFVLGRLKHCTAKKKSNHESFGKRIRKEDGDRDRARITKTKNKSWVQCDDTSVIIASCLLLEYSIINLAFYFG